MLGLGQAPARHCAFLDHELDLVAAGRVRAGIDAIIEVPVVVGEMALAVVVRISDSLNSHIKPRAYK